MGKDAVFFAILRCVVLLALFLLLLPHNGKRAIIPDLCAFHTRAGMPRSDVGIAGSMIFRAHWDWIMAVEVHAV
jgi:hypothetical protein